MDDTMLCKKGTSVGKFRKYFNNAIYKLTLKTAEVL